MIECIELTPEKKNTYRALFKRPNNIQESALLHQETVIKYTIKKHKTFTETLFKQLTQDDQFHHAYHLVLEKLSYHMYTPKKLLEILKKESISKPIQVRVLNQLKTDKYYNESQIIAFYTEDLIERKLYGKSLLKKTLEDHFFDKTLINEQLDKYTPLEEQAICEQFIDKKVRSFKKMPALKIKEKLSMACYKQGFKEALFSHLIDELVKTIDYNEDDLLSKAIDKVRTQYDFSDYKDKQKAIQKLMRQGFTYDAIKRLI